MKIPFVKHAADEYDLSKSPLYSDESEGDGDNVPEIPQDNATPVNTQSLDNTELVDNGQKNKEFEPLASDGAFDWNTYSNIENVLPEEAFKSLPTAEQAINNELPENYEQVINQFFPYITDYNVFGAQYDIAFDALYFLGLGGLGGKTVKWVLGRESLTEEEKKKRDYHNCHCDENNGKEFAINDVLNHAINYASAHGFEPPAPIFGLAGHPNCLVTGTTVLTNHGFKHFDDINNQDLICSMNPETGIIEYVKYIKKIKYHYDGDVIEFKGRGHHSIVTPNHRVLYRKKNGTAMLIDEAHTLLFKRKGVFRIPRTGVYPYRPSTEEDINLARFFGWYLSEGCVTKRGPNWYQLNVAQFKKINLERLYSICIKVAPTATLSKKGVYICGDFAKWIYDLNLGKSHEKYIPTFIKDMGVDALSAFLEEFCLGDGHSRLRSCFGYNSTEATLFTSSKRLRDDLCELIIKCGKSCRWYIGRTKGTMCKHRNGTYTTNNDNYVIAISGSKNTLFDNGRTRFNKSSITYKKYTGYVHCLELEKNGVFCFEYSGSISWTGNCSCALIFNKSENFSSFQNIADNCPGIPANCPPDALVKYKQQIWEKIPDTVYINSRTFPPLFITQKTAAVHHIHTKFAAYSTSSGVDTNRPIQVLSNCIGFMPYGMWTPVKEGSLGFVLNVTGKKALVFLSSYQHFITLPVDSVRVIENMTEKGGDVTSDTHFVSAEGKIGLLCYKANSMFYVFFPNDKTIKAVESVSPLALQA